MDKEIVGRIVKVSTKYLGSTLYATEIFYVAVDDDKEAIALVSERIGGKLDEIIEVVDKLSPATVAFLGMKVRQVRAFGE